MNKKELLKEMRIDLSEDKVVIAYRGKTLGSIEVNWDVVLNRESGGQTPKQERVKQYVEDCDLGWC
ncbi:putative RNA-binding protein Jag [Caldalkalibacillus uzonensis]|uniref:RNA-binding protein Jag n=1 Tax=Caldalkalibacillus uzonensis TaxID=353224 RepID=A0ABU0CUI7_9BACI|nr:hypothetical protein [Caldalkalibacillus uzonensis]MDQ0339792.1 putative RNA-binding protein Jag [Caldalkalibacillus uzonensis]